MNKKIITRYKHFESCMPFIPCMVQKTNIGEIQGVNLFFTRDFILRKNG